jgi:hypothetical protein
LRPEVLFELFAARALVFNLEQCRPLAAQSRRKGICQPEGDELRQTRLVAVRQVTAFMPAAETGIVWVSRRSGASFPGDKIAHAGVVWWP